MVRAIRHQPYAIGAFDAAIKHELAHFTEGEQEAFLRDFLAKGEHRVWTRAQTNTPLRLP